MVSGEAAGVARGEFQNGKRGCDTPAVCVRVANKGVAGAGAVRVARKGLKVAVFLASCGRLVRVANKGLTEMLCL